MIAWIFEIESEGKAYFLKSTLIEWLFSLVIPNPKNNEATDLIKKPVIPGKIPSKSAEMLDFYEEDLRNLFSD
ncbi:MAG: hypothetical protein JSS34_07820 [Proteobacteria bacterium]|nr:hypothetical protein [Pseudomonadota bacterium]